MKLKNVNIVERHVEKVILSVAMLFALYVLWSNVLSSPYAVDVAGKQGLNPDDVDKLVMDEAVDLNRKVTSPSAQFTLGAVPNYTDDFRRRISRTLLDVVEFTTPLDEPGVPKELIDVKPPDPPPVPTFVPPSPTDLRLRTGHGVLAELQDRSLMGEFEQVIGNQRPRDFRYVSISASFNMAAWREQLRKPGDDTIPEDWWRNLMLIADVIVLRERRDPVTGLWVEDPRGSLSVLPGSVSYRDVPTNNLTQQEAEALIRSVRLDQDRITRPDFPILANDMVWLPPDIDSSRLSDDDSKRLLRLQNEIKTLQDQIKQGDAGKADPTKPGAAPGAGAGDKLEKLRKDLEAKIKERNEIQGVRDTSSETTTTAPAAKTAATPGKPDSKTPQSFGPDRVKIWFHDLSVTPGNVYRYRIRVDVASPLFRRAQLRQEQKRQYFNLLALASKPSEYSEPIQVEPPTHFFMVNANQQQQTATVEVWRVFNGKWRPREFTRRAGDPIGGLVRLSADGSEGEVDMRVGAVIVDLDFPTGNRPGAGAQLVYALEHGSGADTGPNVLVRSLDRDRDNAKRRDLRSEAGIK